MIMARYHLLGLSNLGLEINFDAVIINKIFSLKISIIE